MKLRISMCICLSAIYMIAFSQGENLYLKAMKEKWAHAEEYVMACAEAMPAEDYDFKATTEVATFQKQLMHSLQNMNWLTSSYLGGEKLSTDIKTADPTKEELLQLLKQGFEKAARAIDGLTADQLSEKVDFFAGEKTVLQMLELMDDHLTHHKGQLVVYLRLKGITPPKFVGW